MGNFKQLKVWNRAHTLTLRLYTVTAQFPRSELFGLTQQIRRAAVSIEANLAKVVVDGRTANCLDLHLLRTGQRTSFSAKYLWQET